MASAPAEANVDVGRVLGRGFATLGANFLPFLAISLVLVGVPTFVTQYWGSASLDLADPGVAGSPAYWRWLGANLLVGLVAGALLQGLLVRSTILHLSGRDAAPGASALFALRLLPALIGLSLLVGLLLGIGFLLLIVPGVMIYCATVVAVPALIEERRGIYESVQRSRALTRGSRWSIFGLLVLFAIFTMVVQFITGLVTGVTMFNAASGIPDPALVGIAGAIPASLYRMIEAVVVAALYVELREVKEGATVNELAEVFA